MRSKCTSFIAGVLLGALLLGGGRALAANGVSVTGLLRELTVYVDGQPVTVEAVNVADTNYIKLRDVGKVVGFNVWWDGEVRIQTDVPYTGEAPAVAPPAEQSPTDDTPAEAPPAATPDPLAANMEVRERMIALINEVRTTNGLPALPVSQALMDAAQDISLQGFKSHNPYEWEAIAAHGWTNGGGVNLTVFTYGPNTDIAQYAVNNWTYSKGHFQTMIRDDAISLGVGVTFANDRAYCYMIVGSSNPGSPR